MTLFGYADGRRGRAGYIRQLSGGLNLAEGDLGLGVEVDGEFPQLVPGQLVEGLRVIKVIQWSSSLLVTQCQDGKCLPSRNKIYHSRLLVIVT